MNKVLVPAVPLVPSIDIPNSPFRQMQPRVGRH